MQLMDVAISNAIYRLIHFKTMPNLKLVALTTNP